MITMTHIRAGLTVLFMATALPSTVLAHGGEDHGAPAAPAPMKSDKTGFASGDKTGFASGDKTGFASGENTGFAFEGSAFQAVLYPAGEKSILYLADADTNAPISGGTIDAEAGGWQGKATPMRAPGTYELSWQIPEDGADLSLVVSAGGNDDLILIAITGHRATPHQAAATDSTMNWKAVGAAAGIGFLVLAAVAALVRRGRTLAVALLAFGLLGLHQPAHAHGGEDHGAPAAATPAPQPGAPVVMSKPTQFLLGIRTARVEPQQAADSVRVLGRVIADPSGYARLQPSQPARVISDPAHPIPVPGQVVSRGQILAVLEPTLSTLEKGDKRATLSRVDGEITITERTLTREETLGALVPAKQVESTRIRLAQLRKERGQIVGTALGREVLAAPVDGVVTDVHVVPGEVVGPDRILVEIVDPARLRVEAIIHDLSIAKRLSTATATSKMVPDYSFPLTLLGVSPKLDPQDQGVHAIFQVAPDQAGLLSIGVPMDVYLATGATSLRTAVPRDAIAELGGRQVVFIRTAPETFEIRPVRVNRVIGPLAEIAEGVQTGDRVVIQGIEQLKAGR